MVGNETRSIEEELGKSRAVYYAHLGRFIHYYSKCESFVHKVFRASCLGISDDAARVISGGARLSDLMHMSRRLLQINDPKKIYEEIDALFTQLSQTSKLRDTLIHRGIETMDGAAEELKLTSTNEMTAKSIVDVEVLALNLDDIKNAALDCRAIWGRLIMVLEENAFSNEDQRDAYIRKFVHEPWRYKHRQPDTPNRPPRASGR